MNSRSRCGPLFAFLAGLVVLAGCGKAPEAAKDTGKGPTVVAQGNGKTEPADDHSGWWCNEHGLPEEVCDLCSRKYRNAEKAKGNWCEHNRVKTSCFKCNPGVQEKYAAEYRTKFGKEPPAIEGQK
ncbi:MAG: hypothetical protein U0804_01280 [Gemmataceae bacterium]